MTPSSQDGHARVVLGILGAHNLIQNTLLNDKGYVGGNLAISATLVVIGRQSGATWEEMGLSVRHAHSSLRAGGMIAATAAAGAVAGIAHPRLRVLLSEGRTRIGGDENILSRILIRFPIGTALFEEVAFRGVLPATIGGGNWRADLLSAGAFAVWHLIPTSRVQGGVSQDWPFHRRVAVVIGGSVAAGVAGLGLSWLRRRTGGLLAPWLVHATVNSSMFLASELARGMSDDPTTRS